MRERAFLFRVIVTGGGALTALLSVAASSQNIQGKCVEKYWTKYGYKPCDWVPPSEPSGSTSNPSTDALLMQSYNLGQALGKALFGDDDKPVRRRSPGERQQFEKQRDSAEEAWDKIEDGASKPKRIVDMTAVDDPS